MMYLKRILLYSFLIILIIGDSCSEGTGRGLYVSNKGNDLNRGTRRNPLRSIREANRRIMINPSDVYFAGGEVFEGTLVLEGKNGSKSLLLRIGSYGEGKAVISGGNNEAVRVENCSFIFLENLDLRGSGRLRGNNANGLQVMNSEYIIIEDIRAEGFRKSGVDLYNCRNAEVRKVLAYGNGFSGINIMGSHQDSSGKIIIKDCMAKNNPGDPARLDNHSGNGILVGVSGNVVIDHCTATNNGWDMPRKGNGPVGIWAWQSDSVVIQYCISYRNRTSKGGKDGGGFDLDGGVTNSLIQYCLSYENEGAGYGLFQYWGASPWSDNIIRYCVSINDGHTTEGSASFFIWNGSGESGQLKDCYIYNNVSYNDSAPVISFEENSEHENFLFSNNIFIGHGKMIRGENSGSRFMGNVWWGEGSGEISDIYDSMASWSEATGQETDMGIVTGFQEDPGLTGPYTTEITDPYQLSSLKGMMLKGNSPVRNRGVRVKQLYGYGLPLNDFFGNSVPNGTSPEPGIHELD